LLHPVFERNVAVAFLLEKLLALVDASVKVQRTTYIQHEKILDNNSNNNRHHQNKSALRFDNYRLLLAAVVFVVVVVALEVVQRWVLMF